MSTILDMRRVVLPGVLLLALLSACGGGDGDAERGDSDRPESEAPGSTVAKADLIACLTEAGLDAKDSEVDYPDALKERDQIIETIEIAGAADLTGLGHATWYEDEDAAVAGDEAGSLVSTDEVRRGVAGRLAWRWAGEGAAADVIEGCVTD